MSCTSEQNGVTTYFSRNLKENRTFQNLPELSSYRRNNGRFKPFVDVSQQSRIDGSFQSVGATHECFTALLIRNSAYLHGYERLCCAGGKRREMSANNHPGAAFFRENQSGSSTQCQGFSIFRHTIECIIRIRDRRIVAENSAGELAKTKIQ
jgi:hypothetical protein